MNFREIKGDLFNDTEAKIWIQGVNLKSTMGAGIAKEFKRRYPKTKLEELKISFSIIIKTT